MSRLYGPQHRALQDRFDMRRLADGVERRIVATEISANIENSSKAAICSGLQPSITKDGRRCRIKAAILASCAC